jgi:hypothetical protein
LSNKEAHGRKGCLVAIVKGTKAKEVTSILKKIPESVRLLVEEVALDFSDSMHQIVCACFPKAMMDFAAASFPIGNSIARSKCRYQNEKQYSTEILHCH